MTTTPPTPPVDRYRGHEFEYQASSDLFRCVFCEEYEVVARAAAHDSGDPAGITACPGLPAWQADGGERVHLAVTFIPRVCADESRWGVGVLARAVLNTGLGRPCRFGYRDGVMLIETSPSVAERLTEYIRDVQHPDDTSGPMAAHIDVLTAEAAAAHIAVNYAAYVDQYGPPR